MNVSKEFGVCKAGTQSQHLAIMTHKSVVKKITVGVDIKKFKSVVDQEFIISSTGKLCTADAIDHGLAEIKKLGTGTSHQFMMYENEAIRLMPPTEDDVRKMIIELDDVPDDVKECARGALNVILKLSTGNLEFLKST